MNDQIVGADDVLAALNDLRQRGATALLEEIEKLEPTLTEELLNQVSALHKEFGDTALSARQLRRLVRLSESNAIVLVLALRRGYRRLVSDDAANSAPDPPSPPSDEENRRESTP